MTRPVTTLVPWYGSNRTLAKEVAAHLAGCAWVGIPMGGGMSEVLHLTAPSIVVGDLHRHVINLARVVSRPETRGQLCERLDALAFHPDELQHAQEMCKKRESGELDGEGGRLQWAIDYFVTAWMARNGDAGTTREFDASYSVRWDSGGGDSCTRFRNATRALAQWQSIMTRCTFVVMDVFEFLSHCKNQSEVGIYVDPPFPGTGDKYRHRFPEASHRKLASTLLTFPLAKVVVRYYDDPLVRELYPESQWVWHRHQGRTQANGVGDEVLLVRRL